MYKILLLGPLKSPKSDAKVGGAITLFNLLLEDLEERDVFYEVIDTNKSNYKNLITSYLKIFFKFLYKVNKFEHVSFHSSRDYLILSLFLLPITKLFSKKISLRKFGGDPIATVRGSFLTSENIGLKIIKKYDFLFVETKSLLKYFASITENVFWFPNVRNKSIETYSERKFKKRFVFIGHVKKEKGISDLIEASMKISNDYQIDIYGPIENNEYTRDQLTLRNLHYKDKLKSNEVINTLNKYDVLILPSYKEGYPGVIIEAFSLGLPVIASDLENIQEIIGDEVHGKLFNTGNIEQLAKAIMFFNNENYGSISLNAFNNFENFERTVVSGRFLNTIKQNG